MANEINGLNNINTNQVPVTGNQKPQQSRSDGGSTAQSNSTAPTAANTVTDSVSLTDSAKKLQALEKHVAALPVVDSQRVAQIREAIKNGEYKIDAVKTASKMITFEVELIK